MKRLTFLNWSKGIESGKPRGNLASVWIGVATAICLTLLAFTVFGVYALVTDGSIYNYAGIVSTATFLSIFLGGLVAGNLARFQGLFHGGLVGVICSVLLFVLVIALAAEAVNLGLLGRFIGFILLGALGGLLGVNLPQWRPRRVVLPSPRRRRIR